MMTKKKYVSMRESNDKVDHKKMIIPLISFADEVKYYS